MANIDNAFRVDKLSLGDIALITAQVDDPSIGGYDAPVGSIYLRTNGLLYKKTGAGLTDWVAIDSLNVERILTDLHDPTGFFEREDSQISFNDGTLTFTIEPRSPATSYSYYIAGVKHTISAIKSVVLPNVTGNYYIYLDASETLQVTNTFSSDLLTLYGYVAAVYWNATQNHGVYVADERHGPQMDGYTHLYLHSVLGTQWLSGLGITNITVNGDGTLNSHAQVAVNTGTIVDEDLSHRICDTGTKVSVYDLEQELTPNLVAPVFYRLGAAGDWYSKTPDNFPLIFSGTAGYVGANGLPAFNEFTGGVWQLTEVGTGSPAGGFLFAHVLATNDINHPVVVIQGITQYATKPVGRDEARTELSQLSGLPFEEFTPIASLIYEVSTLFTNIPKAIIRSADNGDPYVDWRSVDTFSSATGGGAASDHGNLSGLTDDDHPQYYNQVRGDARYCLLEKLLFRHNDNVVQTFGSIPTTIILGSLVRQDSYYSYNAGEVTINVTGWYQISYDATYTTVGTTAATSQTYITVNDSPLTGSYAYGYHRSAEDGLQTTSSTVIVQLLAGDIVELVGVRQQGATSLTTVASACRLNIRTLNL